MLWEQPVTRAGIPTARQAAASTIAVPVQLPPFSLTVLGDKNAGLVDECQTNPLPRAYSVVLPSAPTANTPPALAVGTRAAIARAASDKDDAAKAVGANI